jgi:cyclic pyranopterin phosphate synthase
LREAEASWLDGTLFGHELRQPGNTPEEMNAYFGEPLLDSFGRRLAYLRFSLTEACNMACTYCLPEGFPEWLRHKARLGEEDIETVLSGFRRLGFRKVRFTGGEPTVHPGLGKAIATARRLGYEKIAMTTNGTLASRLDAWIEQGLDQINISLDSLRPETFRLLTKSRRHQHVMDVIDRALVAGITVKVNTVLMRSANGGEAGELMDWALARPIELRFIELMPTGLNQDFWLRERILSTELMVAARSRGLEPVVAQGFLSGPAKVFGREQSPGRIGFISPLSCNFCGDCNRLRVTARGALKLCLFGDHDHPLDLSHPQAVAASVRSLIGSKGESHGLNQGAIGNVATFRTIGG